MTLNHPIKRRSALQGIAARAGVARFRCARFRCPPGTGWHTSFWMMRHDWRKTADEPAAVQEIDVCEQDLVNRTSYSVNLHR
jgi:hypothetical protein